MAGYDVYNGSTKVNSNNISGNNYTVQNLTACTDYSFEVVAMDAAGNSSSSPALAVKTNCIPTAVINASPTSGAAPLEVSFDAVGSSDPDADDFILGYDWDFDDGSANSNQNQPVHTYSAAGTYVATLRVMDNRNAFSQPVSLTITVEEDTGVPVTGVSLNQSSLSLDEGQTSQLLATVSPTDAANKNVSWSSGNTSVASVSTSGLVTAVGQGTTDITVITQDGGFTSVSSVNVTSGSSGLRNPENPSNVISGIEYNYYHGSWNVLPDFNNLTAEKTGTVNNFDLSVRTQNDDFGFMFSGFIDVPSDGDYTFYTSSDDGSKLYIGSTEVVDNDGLHAVQERLGTIGLKAGKHAIQVTFFEKSGGEALTVSYSGPGVTKQAIPNSALYIVSPGSDTEPPTSPSNVAASSVTNASVDLTWDASSDNVGVVGYDVYNGSTKVNSSVIAGTSFTVQNLAECTGYSFVVEARDAAGNTASSSVLDVTTDCSSGLRNPENPANTINGISYEYYHGSWDVLPDFNNLTAEKTGTVNNFDLGVRTQNDNFGFMYSGYIDVPSDGDYTFYTSSDDGSKLYIGSTEVVDNDGLHAVQERLGTIGLKAGKHAIQVTFFEKSGGESLAVSYSGPGIAKQPVPNSVLYTVSSGNPPVNYSLTLNTSNGAISANPGQSSYEEGSVVSLTATPDAGYQFDGWSGDASGTTNPVSVTMDTDKNITANFSLSTVTTLSINQDIHHQEIDGFGGFGGTEPNWGEKSSIHDDDFVDLMINDLGLSIIRTELAGNFEHNNDNSDPFVTDLSAFNFDTHYGLYEEQSQYRPWINYVKDLKSEANMAGQQLKVLMSVWSPPIWMKYVESYASADITWNRLSNGVGPVPGIVGAKEDMRAELAEYIYAFTQVFNQEAGFEIDAVSFQNEPAFAQGYPSCVYSDAQYRDALRFIGQRLASEGVNVDLFGQEDVSVYERIESYANATGDDMETRHYLDKLAVHGYGADGKSSGGSSEYWQKVNALAKKYNWPVWMTETSGYEDTYAGAMALANSIHAALKHGNVSAWVFWSLNGPSGKYSIVNNGVPSKKYYTSKHYYKHIRPGAIRIDASSQDTSVLITAYTHPVNNTTTIVIINNGTSAKSLDVAYMGSNVPASFDMYLTDVGNDFTSQGTVSNSQAIDLPAQSIVTLHGNNAGAARTFAPSLIVQPVSAIVNTGASVTFNVDAIGTPNLTFQWYKDGAMIPGEDGRSYTIKSVTAADDGSSYYCMVSNDYGSVTSGTAILTVEGFAGLNISTMASTPVIDGSYDSSWDNFPYVSLENIVIGAPSATDISGSFKIGMDASNLYVFVDIIDDTLVVGKDDFELFFDTDNSKDLVYGSNDFQFLFKYGETVPVEWKHGDVSGVQYVTQANSNGYTAEVLIPWSLLGVNPVHGTIVGIDIAADDTDNASRQSKIAWHTNNNDIWFNPSLMGVGQLSSSLKDGEILNFENKNLTNKHLRVYPNPVLKNTTVSISGFHSDEVVQLRIMSIEGKLITANKVEMIDGEHIMQLNSLKSGIYFIQVDTNSKSTMKKLIVR